MNINIYEYTTNNRGGNSSRRKQKLSSNHVYMTDLFGPKHRSNWSLTSFTRIKTLGIKKGLWYKFNKRNLAQKLFFKKNASKDKRAK